MSFTVAIDGPAASGKGTIARAIAKTFGLAHLDTGLLYRAVGARFLLGVDPARAACALEAEDLNADDLRSPEVSQAASQVASVPEVRAALLLFQRDFARQPGGAVLDGRDIGTVICPEAEVKLFVTADQTTRAARRFAELEREGHVTSLGQVLDQIVTRDARDAGRSDAPLRAAEDAVVIDTSSMDIAAAIDAAVAVVSRHR